MEKIKLLLLVSVLFLGGCSFLPNPLKMFKMGSSAQEQKFSYEEAIKIKPHLVYDSKGNPSCEKEIDYTYRTDWQQKDRELGFFQKTWKTFLQLGLFGIVIGVVCMFCPPLAMFLGFAGRATEYSMGKVIRVLDKSLAKHEDKDRQDLIKELDPKTKLKMAKLKFKNNGE